MDAPVAVAPDDAIHVQYKYISEIVRIVRFLLSHSRILKNNSVKENRLYYSNMRLWSLHPQYLDSKWLVALWREWLLAQHVLEGRTKWYIHHPQLERFRDTTDPLSHINAYLSEVYQVATLRWYHFDSTKLSSGWIHLDISVTRGQIEFELSHLKAKLKLRDRKKYEELENMTHIVPHPLFTVIDWGIAPWERL